MTPPKKEEDVKPQITTIHEEDAQVGVIQTPKTEEKQAETVSVKKEEKCTLYKVEVEQTIISSITGTVSYKCTRLRRHSVKCNGRVFLVYVNKLENSSIDLQRPHFSEANPYSFSCGCLASLKKLRAAKYEVKSEVPDIMTKIDEVVTDLNQERPPSEETLAKFEAQLTDIFNKVENKLNNFCVQFSINPPSKT
ncbi:hypothetical protein ACOSP7_012383 [Xanthoceras sorbifolium]